MNEIVVIATLRLNDESLLEDWKVISDKIDVDLVGQDGFISRYVGRREDGLIYCILKWESKAKQEKFMTALMARTDKESQAMMEEFGRIVNVEGMKREFLEVL
ncbi:MAG: hypothetical protein DSZ12_03080 [Sulfurovum sp.]|nr:MAG: hypothetical protein DSZ12_03080 [Sulfurovum sp.]